MLDLKDIKDPKLRPDTPEFHKALQALRAEKNTEETPAADTVEHGASSVRQPIFGWDCSNNNPLDVAKAKQEGYGFGIFKVSQGDYFKDTYYAGMRDKAQASGLLHGGYHFLEHGNIKGQLDLFLSLLGNPEGKLVAVDVESGGYRGDPAAADVWDFVLGLKQRIGDHPILVYSGNWYWSGHIGNPRLSDLKDKHGVDVRLWDSHYVTTAGYGSAIYQNVPSSWLTDKQYGNMAPTILQFTSNAVIAGLRAVDANAFAGSMDELKALTTSKSQPNPVKPSPSGPSVKLVATTQWGNRNASAMLSALKGNGHGDVATTADVAGAAQAAMDGVAGNTPTIVLGNTPWSQVPANLRKEVEASIAAHKAYAYDLWYADSDLEARGCLNQAAGVCGLDAAKVYKDYAAALSKP